MKKYQCSVCGYVYDEAKGDASRGIPPGTKWENLPPDWSCPDCGAVKEEFKEIVELPIASESSASVSVQENSVSDVPFFPEHTDAMRKLSASELTVVFTNLEKASRKMGRLSEAEKFLNLAEYFRKKSLKSDASDFSEISTWIEKDLTSGYPEANNIAQAVADHGALRALSWGEKTAKMQKSLLARFAKEGSAILTNSNIYVCEACGFIYIGNEPPAVCPACKALKIRFTKIERP